MKRVLLAMAFGGALSGAFFWREVFRAVPRTGEVIITIARGESAFEVARRLEREGAIRSAKFFAAFARWKGIDTRLSPGTYVVRPPATLARVVKTLAISENRQERTITIFPGWDLRDTAVYMEERGLATAEKVFETLGRPAEIGAPRSPPAGLDEDTLASKPAAASFEGYIAPETYRIFADATFSEIAAKLINQRAKELDADLRRAIAASGRSFHEILTMASIVEREARRDEDRPKIADIFWRRISRGWALQADSTVHYALGKKGDVFTSRGERAADSPWNTYKYPGLPPGPIASPGLASIRAAVFPEKNDYWFFLTTSEGEAKYARTLEEHNANRARFLR